jgi:hypothetical protein
VGQKRALNTCTSLEMILKSFNSSLKMRVSMILCRLMFCCMCFCLCVQFSGEEIFLLRCQCPWCHVRNWRNGKCIVQALLPGVRALLKFCGVKLVHEACWKLNRVFRSDGPLVVTCEIVRFCCTWGLNIQIYLDTAVFWLH